jgi:TolB protein
MLHVLLRHPSTRAVVVIAVVAALAACSDGHRSGTTASPTVPTIALTGPPPPAPPPPPPATAAPQPAVAQLSCTSCKRIAFTSARDGNPEIYSVNADGTGLTRLTYNAAVDDEATWSPDGRHIAFTSNRNGASELFVMNADGSGVRRTAPLHLFVQHPSWSPDGTKIAYTAMGDGSADLWAVDAGNGLSTLLFSTPGYDNQQSWAPDGAKLAFVSDWFAYDFVYDLFVINADGSGFAALTGGNFDGIDYVSPSWSPNGAKIAMTISQEVGINEYVTHVGVMNADGSGLTHLIGAATYDRLPWSTSSWSPDGTMIAFTSGSSGAYDVSWIKVDRSVWGTITTNGWNPDWQH